MHPGSGVCKIEAIKGIAFTADSDDKKDYYVLKPVYGGESTTIYVPVGQSKINLRKLLSEKDIIELIHSVHEDPPLWDDNDVRRKEIFSQVLHSENHAKIIQLIIELHKKREEKQAAGKKLHASDARTLEEAEKLIHQEFAYSLNLKIDEVAPFIRNELNT